MSIAARNAERSRRLQQQQQSQQQREKEIERQAREKEIERQAAQRVQNRGKQKQKEENKKKGKITKAEGLLSGITDDLGVLRIQITDLDKIAGGQTDGLKNIVKKIYETIGGIRMRFDIAKKVSGNSEKIQGKIIDYGQIIKQLELLSNKINKLINDLNEFLKVLNGIGMNMGIDKMSLERLNTMATNKKTVKTCIDKIKNNLLKDRVGTIKENIKRLNKIIGKTAKYIFSVPLKSTKKGIPKKIKNLQELLGTSSDAMLINSVKQNLVSINQKAKTIKNSPLKNTPALVAPGIFRGGSLHKHLKVSKKYQFRKASIERLSKIGLNEEFTFRNKKFKMTKSLKNKITNSL